jgi:hypothetical protein
MNLILDPLPQLRGQDEVLKITSEQTRTDRFIRIPITWRSGYSDSVSFRFVGRRCRLYRGMANAGMVGNGALSSLQCRLRLWPPRRQGNSDMANSICWHEMGTSAVGPFVGQRHDSSLRPGRIRRWVEPTLTAVNCYHDRPPGTQSAVRHHLLVEPNLGWWSVSARRARGHRRSGSIAASAGSGDGVRFITLNDNFFSVSA